MVIARLTARIRNRSWGYAGSAREPFSAYWMMAKVLK